MLNVKKLLTYLLRATVKTYDVNYSGSKTIGSSGYTNLGSVLPNNTIVSMMVLTWGSSTNAFSVAKGKNNSIYLVGTPNTTVSDLGVRILYL